MNSTQIFTVLLMKNLLSSKGSRKNESCFFSGPATKAPPPPPELSGHIFLGNSFGGIFLSFKKSYFFLLTRPFQFQIKAWTRFKRMQLNYRFHSTRAHLLLSYLRIQVPSSPPGSVQIVPFIKRKDFNSRMN